MAVRAGLKVKILKKFRFDMRLKNVAAVSAALLFIATTLFASANEKRFTFAYLSDVHIALGSQSVEDARACIDDINNNQAHFDAIEKLKCSLKNCVGVDFLPCHNMGEAKARMLE